MLQIASVNDIHKCCFIEKHQESVYRNSKLPTTQLSCLRKLIALLILNIQLPLAGWKYQHKGFDVRNSDLFRRAGGAWLSYFKHSSFVIQ